MSKNKIVLLDKYFDRMYSIIAETCRKLDIPGYIVMHVYNDIYKFSMFDYDFKFECYHKYGQFATPVEFSVISLKNRQSFKFNMNDVHGKIAWELVGTEEMQEEYYNMLKGALCYAGYVEYE